MSTVERSSTAAGRPANGNWFAIAAYAALAAATQLLWLTFAPITTESAAFYGVGESAIDLLSIIFPLLYVVFAIPSGLGLDRWFRPSLLIGGALTVIGALIRILDSHSYQFALIGQIVIAVGQPFVLNAVTKLAANYLPRSQRPTGIAVGSAGLFVGMLISFILGAALGGNIPLLLLIEAGIAVLGMVLTIIALLQPGRFIDDIEIGAAETVEAATERPLRTVVGDPVLRLLIGVVLVGNGIFVALTTLLQQMLAPAGVSASMAGIMLAVMVVGGVVGAVVLPPSAAKRGNQTTWMLIAVSVVLIGFLALAVVPGNVSGLIVSALTGFLLMAMLPIVLEMVEQRAGPAAGTATALVWMAGNGAGVVFSVVIGVVSGNPALGFVVMAALMGVTGYPIFITLHRRLRTERAALAAAANVAGTPHAG